MKTPPAYPVTGVAVQQLPHQYGGELRHLRDEPFGGERGPLRRLPQRLVYRGGQQRRAGHGVVSQSRGHRRTRLRHLPCQRGQQLHQLGGRKIRPRCERHQLLELPQRHAGAGADDAAACPGHRRPVQQLPHQYGDQLRHLHDEPLGGERRPLRLLPQRLVHGEGTKGALGTASYAGHVATTGRDCITCHASAATSLHQLGRRRLRPPAERHQLLELPQRDDRDRQHHAAAYPGRPASSAAIATPTRRRVSSPTR